jgi:limonene 1,2-monooxygenase
MSSTRLRFGAFIAPFHAVEENPTLAIERDLELVQWMDRLDYDEAWIGEHHSAGFEVIASPEVFIAFRRRAHQAHPPRHRASPPCRTTTR